MRAHGRELSVSLETSRQWDRAVAVWGFSEAIFWFVVPDVFLLPTSVARPEGAWRRAGICWVGSLLGITVWWAWVTSYGVPAWLYSLPWTYPTMATEVLTLARDGGVWLALSQPMSTIPVKVWVAALVPSREWAFLPFLFWVGLARGGRMLAFSLLGGLLGRRYPWLGDRRLAWGYALAIVGMLHALSEPFRSEGV